MRDTKELITARAAEPDPYARRFVYPKWTRTVTVCDEPKLFRRLPEFREWNKAEHDAAARDYLATALCLEPALDWIQEHASRIHGDRGSWIAGGFRESWPDAWKDACRTHSRLISNRISKANAHWRAAHPRQTPAEFMRIVEATRRALRLDMERYAQTQRERQA